MPQPPYLLYTVCVCLSLRTFSIPSVCASASVPSLYRLCVPQPPYLLYTVCVCLSLRTFSIPYVGASASVPSPYHLWVPQPPYLLHTICGCLSLRTFSIPSMGASASVPSLYRLCMPQPPYLLYTVSVCLSLRTFSIPPVGTSASVPSLIPSVYASASVPSLYRLCVPQPPYLLYTVCVCLSLRTFSIPSVGASASVPSLYRLCGPQHPYLLLHHHHVESHLEELSQRQQLIPDDSLRPVELYKLRPLPLGTVDSCQSRPVCCARRSLRFWVGRRLSVQCFDNRRQQHTPFSHSETKHSTTPSVMGVISHSGGQPPCSSLTQWVSWDSGLLIWWCTVCTGNLQPQQ